MKLHAIAQASLATIRDGGKPVDNSAAEADMEGHRARMRSEIAAEVRLREAAQADAQAKTEELGRLTQDLEDKSVAFTEACERIEALTGDLDEKGKRLETALGDLERGKEATEQLRSTHEDTSRELTAQITAANTAQAIAQELRAQLKGEAGIGKRLDALEAAIRAAKPAPARPAAPIEPPEYEFHVSARDGNNRVASIKAVPVKR
jgi:chromosome segregation ATPase